MKMLLIASSLVLSLGAAVVLAHGDKDHGAKDALPVESHAASLGRAGDPARVSRTVAVEMSDVMRFTPATINVKRGETVRFLLTNTGTLKHEMVLGTATELKKHAALMQKFPEMEHAEPNMVTVEPGNAGELVWQFTKAGRFEFACLQPGHFEAGMVGRVVVER